jgi:hypothetical protein
VPECGGRASHRTGGGKGKDAKQQAGRSTEGEDAHRAGQRLEGHCPAMLKFLGVPAVSELE